MTANFFRFFWEIVTSVYEFYIKYGRQILTYFCDVTSLLVQVFIVSFDRDVYKNILQIF